MSATDKAKPRTARQVAASLKALGGRIVAVVDKLDRVGDAPVPADAAKELTDLATAMRQAVEPTPPSATEKREEGWPRDMSAPASSALTWGRDPEDLRHG